MAVRVSTDQLAKRIAGAAGMATPVEAMAALTRLQEDVRAEAIPPEALEGIATAPGPDRGRGGEGGQIRTRGRAEAGAEKRDAAGDTAGVVAEAGEGAGAAHEGVAAGLPASAGLQAAANPGAGRRRRRRGRRSMRRRRDTKLG